MTGAALVVDGGLTAAGGGVMKTFGLDQLMLTGVGVDRGTTGLEGTARPVV